MKLNQDNVFEMQLWNDVFRSWLKDRGGPAYTESGNEQARLVAGRQADLAVETMRERMPAPRADDLRARPRLDDDETLEQEVTRLRAEQAPAATLTETPESFRQTSESDGRARERADVLDFMRHPPGSITDSQRRFLGELVKAIERGTHAGCASRLYAEQVPARVTAERLHVKPHLWMASSEARALIAEVCDTQELCDIKVTAGGQTIAVWSLSSPEQAEALVAAFLSIGVGP